MLTVISTEREGIAVDRQLLKDMKEVLLKMKTYDEDFELPLLDMTKKYYAGLSNQYISTSSTSEYLMHADKCLKQEGERVFGYLNYTSEDPLLQVCKKELIYNHHVTLLRNPTSGCQVPCIHYV